MKKPATGPGHGSASLPSAPVPEPSAGEEQVPASTIPANQESGTVGNVRPVKINTVSRAHTPPTEALAPIAKANQEAALDHLAAFISAIEQDGFTILAHWLSELAGTPREEEEEWLLFDAEVGEALLSSPRGTDRLNELLEALPDGVTVHLGVDSLSADQLGVLLSALEKNRPISGLTLQGLNTEQAKALAKVLERSESLRYLSLAGSPIGDAGVIHVANGLQKNKVLRSLALADFGKPASSVICDMIHTSATLQDLRLECRYLPQIADSSDEESTPSNRQQQPIDESDFVKIANAIKTSAAITSVALDAGPEVGTVNDAGLEAIADCLEHNDRLESMSLTFSQIKDLTVPSLVRAIEKNTHLRRLELTSDNGAEYEILNALCAVLKTNRTLHEIEIPFHAPQELRATLQSRLARNCWQIRCGLEHTLGHSHVEIALPKMTEQTGHVCKPTSLATLDRYYADRHGVRNFPLHVNRNGYYEIETNAYWPSNLARARDEMRSIRRLTKDVAGSVQGEVLEAKGMVSVAQKMGYAVRIHRSASLEEFAAVIVDALKSGNPPLACFTLSTSRNGDTPKGWPSRFSLPEREHACLIVGIDTRNETVTIAHAGNLYPEIPINCLYDAMQNLADTREPEAYARADGFPEGWRSLQGSAPVKYDLVPFDSVEEERTILRSIVPAAGTGFRNSIFLIAPDLTNERWQPANEV